MAELPDYLDVRRHRDVSFRAELAARWTVLGLLTAIAVVALFGVFGQEPRQSAAAAGAAELEVSAPTAARGGLFFQGRIDRNLRRERLTTAELAAEARLQQIPSLADVRWGVLETSGKISFIPRADG